MNNKKKKEKNVKRKFLYSKLFLGIALIFIFSLLVLLIAEFIDFQKLFSSFDEPKLIQIKDECSLIMGNLVHQVRDEADCNIRCYNRCVLEDSKIKNIEFIKFETSCNICNCYCK